MTRQSDRDRFLCALFAPAAARPDLMALLAFNAEVGRIPGSVSESLIGLMRVQWWRDVIGTVADGGSPPLGNPVAESLAGVIRRHALTAAGFEPMLEARAAEVEGERPVSQSALEMRAAAIDGTLAEICLDVLGVAAPAARDAARHVGIAWGLLGRLRSLPYAAGPSRTPFPSDWYPDAGLDPEAGASPGPGPAAAQLSERLSTVVGGHLHRARASARKVPRQAGAALLPATLADGYLKRLRRAGHDPFDAGLRASATGSLLRLAWNAARGRY